MFFTLQSQDLWPSVGPEVFALSPYNVFAPREVKQLEDQLGV